MKNKNYKCYCCYPVDWNYEHEEEINEKNSWHNNQNCCDQQDEDYNEECENKHHSHKQKCIEYDEHYENENSHQNHKCNNNLTKRCNCFICRIFKCFK